MKSLKKKTNRRDEMTVEFENPYTKEELTPELIAKLDEPIVLDIGFNESDAELLDSMADEPEEEITKEDLKEMK
jgi:hypothetical protein